MCIKIYAWVLKKTSKPNTLNLNLWFRLTQPRLWLRIWTKIIKTVLKFILFSCSKVWFIPKRLNSTYHTHMLSICLQWDKLTHIFIISIINHAV